MSRLQAMVIDIVRRRGLTHSPEPFRLASGELSKHFIDGKEAFASGADLRIACEAIAEGLRELEIDFDAVGGLTMGADAFAHGIALLEDKLWFIVRKERKERGTNKLIEGAAIGHETRVLLVDDVVTTGGSIQLAYEAIRAQGADVVAATTLVDRGDIAGAFFDERRVPYLPLVSYRDLGIPAVGSGLIHA